MSISVNVNGKSQVPPGFRFHPTEEELLQYYLRKKVSHEKIDLDVILDVDLNKLEPWDIQDKCKIGSTPQNDWYFFSHKDKKYPTGTRTNRATAVGFWKATGRDKVIRSNGNRIGMRKTLVFYKGRAPHGRKSDWIMHEYRLDDNNTSETTITTVSNPNNVMGGDTGPEEGWVVCRIFKKKNHLKTLDCPLTSSPISTTGGEITRRSHLVDSCDEGALEQILENNVGNGSRAGFDNGCYHDRFMKLPGLDSPATKSTSMVSQQNINNNNNNGNGYHPINMPVEMVTVTDKGGSFTTTTLTHLQMNGAEADTNTVHPMEATSSMAVAVGSGGCLTNWAALDRLVASQLNGQIGTWKQLPYFNDPINTNTSLSYCTSHHDLQVPSLRSSTHDYTTEIDPWHFAPSTSSLSFPTSEPLCYVFNSSL